MNWKKAAIIAGVGLVLWLIISTPERAAGTVQTGFGHLESAANSIVQFVTNIF